MLHRTEPRMDEMPSDLLPRLWSAQTRLGEALRGRRGLVVGIADARSIAYGCAAVLRACGAELALTWRNEKAEPHVRPLAERLGARLAMPLDVEQPGAMEAVFARLGQEWGRLDFVIHSIAFAPRADLHGRVVDCSAEGFAQAMHVSCWSFLRMAHLAEPLMGEGGALVTMSYHGAERVVDHYSLMGPVKAALEAAVRYAAAELGPRGIRVFAVSPGPMPTRAASGIARFDTLLEMAERRAPQQRLVDIAEVGRVVAFLVSGAASGMTGEVIHVDGGLHIRA
ncbi:enoyl-ACP reductase FabI [Rubritepida flocculans]